jgi:hypothetical protein
MAVDPGNGYFCVSAPSVRRRGLEWMLVVHGQRPGRVLATGLLHDHDSDMGGMRLRVADGEERPGR